MGRRRKRMAAVGGGAQKRVGVPTMLATATGTATTSSPSLPQARKAHSLVRRSRRGSSKERLVARARARGNENKPAGTPQDNVVDNVSESLDAPPFSTVPEAIPTQVAPPPLVVAAPSGGGGTPAYVWFGVGIGLTVVV